MADEGSSLGLDMAWLMALGTIGEGTYGSVARARCLRSGALVAVKTIVWKSLDKPPAHVGRELAALRSLRHDNIIRLLGCMQDGGAHTTQLLLEFAEHDLSGLIRDGEEWFDLSARKAILIQSMRGLKFMHDNGILHMDLKPANILVTRSGVAKLCDFGLSRRVGPSATLQDGEMACTLRYRPPELFCGQRQLHQTMDIWSLGCVAFELFAGVPLFSGLDAASQLEAIKDKCGDPGPYATVRKHGWFRRIGTFHSTGTVEQTMHSERRLVERAPGAPRFLQTMLQWNPEDRRMQVAHEFLQGAHEQQVAGR